MIVGINGLAISLPFGKGSNRTEVVEIVEKSGIERLTIPVRSPAWKIDPLIISDDEVISIKKALGSKVIATSLGFIWPNDYQIVTSSKAEWTRNLNYANKISDLAQTLEVEYIIFGSAGRSIPADIPYHDGVKTLTKFLREICGHAEDLGVAWLIEQCSKVRTNVGNTTKDLLNIIHAVGSPSLQMCAQISDMAVNDVDVPEAIRASGDLLRMVHVADVVDLNPLVGVNTFPMIPGKGILDWVATFRALKDVNYNGEVCIEAMLGDDPVSDLIECKGFLEAKWKEA
jgi:sugar phosphate isomerase/epimerase